MAKILYCETCRKEQLFYYIGHGHNYSIYKCSICGTEEEV